MQHKLRARWAKASDPDEGRLLETDGKAEGVWPLEPVPAGFRADKFDGEFVHGSILHTKI